MTVSIESDRAGDLIECADAGEIQLLRSLTSAWTSFDLASISADLNQAIHLLIEVGWAEGCGRGLISRQDAPEVIRIEFQFSGGLADSWINKELHSILPLAWLAADGRPRAPCQFQQVGLLQVRLTSRGLKARQAARTGQADDLLYFLHDEHPRSIHESPPGRFVILSTAIERIAAALPASGEGDLSSASGEPPLLPEKPYTHRPFPGSNDWHNWALGVDKGGRWHLFHYQRWGDATGVFRWVRHRYARIHVAAGKMTAVAQEFVSKGYCNAGSDRVRELKSTISRLRQVIVRAVRGEGHRPQGSPIRAPSSDRMEWTPVIRFGKVRRRHRHYRITLGDPR